MVSQSDSLPMIIATGFSSTDKWRPNLRRDEGSGINEGPHRRKAALARRLLKCAPPVAGPLQALRLRLCLGGMALPVAGRFQNLIVNSGCLCAHRSGAAL